MSFSDRNDRRAAGGARAVLAFTFSAARMPATRKLTLFLVLASFPVIARAADITLQDTFGADDNVQLFSVSLAAPAPLDIRSYGYAGGTTSTGTVVPRGGGPQLTASTVAIPVGYLQVTTGKFGFTNGNPYDQIVFHMSSTSDGGRFFQVLSADPTDLTLTAHSGITYNQYPCAAGVQVGNFDNQQTNQRNPNSQIAFLYCSNGTSGAALNIYPVDPQTFDVTDQGAQLSGRNLGCAESLPSNGPHRGTQARFRRYGQAGFACPPRLPPA